MKGRLETVLGGQSTLRARLRFLEEARATAQLEHPNIVPVAVHFTLLHAPAAACPGILTLRC